MYNFISRNVNSFIEIFLKTPKKGAQPISGHAGHPASNWDIHTTIVHTQSDDRAQPHAVAGLLTLTGCQVKLAIFRVRKLSKQSSILQSSSLVAFSKHPQDIFADSHLSPSAKPTREYITRKDICYTQTKTTLGKYPSYIRKQKTLPNRSKLS